MRKTALLLTVVVALFASCKKDEVKAKTNEEKIIGKWFLKSQVDNEFYDNMDHKSTETFAASDYLEFKTNNKIYVFIDGDLDSSNYSISNNNKLAFDGSPILDIKVLTDTKLELYGKETFSTSPLTYYESTITLAK